MSARRGTRVTAATLRFRFDGRTYEAQQGDTAASALLAAGVPAFGRSMKYRRLRGVFTAGAEEPSALLTVGTGSAVIPNVPAPQLLLADGMDLRSQNRWPSLHWDLASLLQAGGGLFGAGFYYKTFLWPSWRAYEPFIRRLAGLGSAPGTCALPPASTEHATCDVLVAGAGAAGLAAARAAARAGARVMLWEREPRCGGELEFEPAVIEGQPALAWVDATLEELRQRGARILTHTALVGGSGGELVAHRAPAGMPGADTLLHVRPRALVLATGAVERPIAFAGNDLPGVLLQGAAERYLARYGVAAGRDVVLFANHDRMYATAQRLVQGGVRVRALVDTRTEDIVMADPALAQRRAQLQSAGAQCLFGHAVLASAGGRRVQGALVAPLLARQRVQRIACDAILVSGGWTPEVHAGLQDGARAQYKGGLAAFVAAGQPAWRAAAGAAQGCLDLAAALAGGHAAGAQAAGAAGAGDASGAVPVATHGDALARLSAFWRSPSALAAEKRVFLDLQNDVTVADVRQALAEGFRDIEHLKRYTTLGMGTEQGRTGALLGTAVLAELKGESVAQVGVSRPRPPYQPVPLRALSAWRDGAGFRPERRTPLHDWHAAHGGVLDPMGLWMRPRYYRGNGSDGMAAAVAEARRVREAGGVVDASTLGKLEVAGADAAAFLDGLYLTAASRIPVGRARYMVNLREDGMALDDGIVLRLAPDRFLATTSSSHGLHMLSHFEFHRATQWAGRAVAVTDTTEAWAVIAVAGPRSRAGLQAVLGEAWQAPLATLAHMAFVDGTQGDSALRVVRAGYSGELSFELHCRPAAATALWEALVAQGLAPYGIDALDILRVEKGYLSASEINGQTTPLDLGMDALVAQGNPCEGRELLGRPAFTEGSRPRLVGLRSADGRAALRGGMQVTVGKQDRVPCGYVTSAAYSPALGEWVALALVARDEAKEGRRLFARDPLRGVEHSAVVVTPTAHFDPAGERMKG